MRHDGRSGAHAQVGGLLFPKIGANLFDARRGNFGELALCVKAWDDSQYQVPELTA